ncbi:MAG TPA: HEAT repeat domain-containing protein [Dehalococcoidia bacterium]|nr:HEAT repeat domain-containing protein [Dehalococcoidia bacterium]
MSLETLLPKLEADDRPPPATELIALSGLAGADRGHFLDVWKTLSIQRRRDIIDMLSDLIEDNVELDFSAVFFVGLLDDDVQVRAESIKALWEYEGDDLAGILIRLLHDPEALVRAEAALGLGRCLLRAEIASRDGALVREIKAALRATFRDEAELAEVRGRAIEALGVASDDWVPDLIEDAYGSADRRLTISAVHAMGRNADGRWLPTILDEIISDDAEMRFEAATAAGAIGDEAALAALAGLAHDDDAEVQEAAIAAIGQVGGPAARSILHAIAAEHDDERVLEAVSDALAEADFIEDPLGFRMYLDKSVAEDEDEDGE